MLELINVTKTFGDIAALSDISFKVDDGEFVFISGPSGAGKTTLLRLLIREIKANQGEIILDGKNIAKLSSKEVPRLRQHIGTIFQDFKVIPERTVAENVEVALAVIGLPKNEWPARTEHVLRLVGLSDRANLFPSQLSGGELQRVSMARALVVNPKIILADEPTGNLDSETADGVMDLFEKINKEGKTVIMATHNERIIEKYKKREIKIKEGRIVGQEKVKSEEKIEEKEEEEKEEEKKEEKPKIKVR